MKTTKNNLKKKLTKKFRLVVLNEASFEERFSFKLTRLNVFVFGGIFSIILVGITVIIIAFTPIKEYIPGYSSTALKKQATSLFYKVDSLQSEVDILTKFTAAIRPILIGKDTLVDVTLPYKNVAVDESKVLKFPVRNDSIAALIAKVKKEMDSTYKAFYKNQTDLLQKKHQETEGSLQDLNKKNLDQLKVEFVSTIERQEDSLQQLKLNILSFTKENSELKKQIALKDIESKHNMQSLSKEKQASLALQNKNSEKARKEVKELLQKEYKENEGKLLASHQKELTTLNASLFEKDAIIDSLIFQVLEQRQKKIGEIANEKPFKEVDESAEKLLVRSF